jgi:hypothetical protein
MAKMAKDTQTDYTRGGKAISDTAIPLYQGNLRRMDDYLENPQRSINTYLDTYFNPENAAYNDFLRNYTRRMADTTAHNYSATGGGYSTSGQRAYDDQQRAQNDLASRLRQYGIDTAYKMANTDFQNMRGANTDYFNAYNLGKAYSDIERYNNMVRQNNSFLNQLGGALPAVGSAVGSLFGPAGAAIGNAVGGLAGNAMTTDTSSLQNVLGAGGANQAAYNAAQGQMYVNNPKTGEVMYNPNTLAGVFGALSNRVPANPQASNTSAPLFSTYLQPYTSATMASNSGFGRNNYFGG